MIKKRIKNLIEKYKKETERYKKLSKTTRTRAIKIATIVCVVLDIIAMAVGIISSKGSMTVIVAAGCMLSNMFLFPMIRYGILEIEAICMEQEECRKNKQWPIDMD